MEDESGLVNKMQEFSQPQCAEAYPSEIKTQEVGIRLGKTLIMQDSRTGGRFLSFTTIRIFRLMKKNYSPNCSLKNTSILAHASLTILHNLIFLLEAFIPATSRRKLLKFPFILFFSFFLLSDVLKFLLVVIS